MTTKLEGLHINPTQLEEECKHFGGPFGSALGADSQKMIRQILFDLPIGEPVSWPIPEGGKPKEELIRLGKLVCPAAHDVFLEDFINHDPATNTFRYSASPLRDEPGRIYYLTVNEESISITVQPTGNTLSDMIA